MLTIHHSHIRLPALAACLVLAGTATAERPAILTDADAPYLPDFSYAGFDHGESAIPAVTGTVISVDDHGAKANDQIDDSDAIAAAIAKANTLDGAVVIRFGPGRYILSDVLRIERGHLVLRGAGSSEGGTTLHIPRPLAQTDTGESLNELRSYLRKLNKRQVEPDRNIDSFFSEYSWSGGFIWVQKPGTRPAAYLPEYDKPLAVLADIVSGTRGSTDITVSNTQALAVGDVIRVVWMNRDGEDAKIIDEIYGPDVKVGSHHWTFPERPLVVQMARIKNIDGDSVSLSNPLMHNAGPGLSAQLAGWDHLKHVGVEDLHIEFPVAPWFGHHMERGYNGIYMTSAYDSWIRNVRITNADAGILSYNSANLSFDNIKTDGTRPAHYGVHMGNVHNVLATNVTVFNPVLHSLTFNTQSTKCVYRDAVVYGNAVLDQHAGSNHQNLFDNLRLYVNATQTKDGPVATLFDGSGAGYWQPGHGSFNTAWNLEVIVESGSNPGDVVTLLGVDEGPDGRIVGLHGNREFQLDYRPEPYVESLNRKVETVPSLLEYQLRQRLNDATTD